MADTLAITVIPTKPRVEPMSTTPMPQPVIDMLRLPNPAVMATVAKDGRPVSVATWYILEDDGRLLLGLDAKRARIKHMERDPRISLTVLAQDDWYTHVSLQGKVVSIVPDEGLREIDRLSRHYGGQPYANRESPRVAAHGSGGRHPGDAVRVGDRRRRRPHRVRRGRPVVRLFVAVLPPDEVLDDLEAHVEPRRDAGPEIRWTDRHQWHVTLAFLGAVPEARVEPLTDALAEAAARRDPLVLRLAGAGAFPGPDAARVLWAGVEQLRGDFGAAAAGIRRRASAAGASPDGTRFRPHVTLGRFHRPTEATRWIRALDAWESPAWQVGAFALVESHLGQGRERRPRYEVLAELSLRP